MKKTLLAATILPLLLTGCGYSFDKPSTNIEPIKDVQALQNVCVYQSDSSMLSYDGAEKLITDKLTSLNVSYKTTKDNLANCSYTLAYDVRRAVDTLTYLANLDIQVNDSEGYSIGSAKYYFYNNGGLLTLSSASFKSTDSEINKLLDQLFNVQSSN